MLGGDEEEDAAKGIGHRHGDSHHVPKRAAARWEVGDVGREVERRPPQQTRLVVQETRDRHSCVSVYTSRILVTSC